MTKAAIIVFTIFITLCSTFAQLSQEDVEKLKKLYPEEDNNNPFPPLMTESGFADKIIKNEHPIC